MLSNYAHEGHFEKSTYRAIMKAPCFVPEECKIREFDDEQIQHIGKEILDEVISKHGVNTQSINIIKRKIKEKQNDWEYLVRIAKSKINSSSNN